MKLEKVYTDLIPKGVTLEYNGKIVIGTNEKMTVAKRKKDEKESA
jgi:hypothetical protein